MKAAKILSLCDTTVRHVTEEDFPLWLVFPTSSSVLHGCVLLSSLYEEMSAESSEIVDYRI